MKLIFNDATELTIQSAEIRVDGSLLIKTISKTEEELREIFSDNLRTQKMVTKERESTVAEYEDYTTLNAIVKYTAGILGVVLYKPCKTPQERMDALERALETATQTIDTEGNLTDQGKPGMSVTTGLWYTDGENVREAIKDGVPASLEDKEYFDIKEA